MIYWNNSSASNYSFVSTISAPLKIALSGYMYYRPSLWYSYVGYGIDAQTFTDGSVDGTPNWSAWLPLTISKSSYLVPAAGFHTVYGLQQWGSYQGSYLTIYGLLTGEINN
jgi:hypothetical protein